MKKNLSKFIVAFIAVIAFSYNAKAQMGVNNATTGTTIDNVSATIGVDTYSVSNVAPGASDSDINVYGATPASPSTFVVSITCGGTTGTATFVIPTSIPSPYYTQTVTIAGGGCAGSTATIFYYPTDAFVIEVL